MSINLLGLWPLTNGKKSRLRDFLLICLYPCCFLILYAGGGSSTHLLPLVNRGQLAASYGEKQATITMILENISLKQYSNYAIGGTARYFCHAKGLHHIAHAVSFARKKKLPLFVVGGGTNILFSDTKFKGLMLKPDIRFISTAHALPETVAVSCGAGVPVSDLLALCSAKGFSGLEWAGGLPGTVGGAVRGNAGAFGGEIKDSIISVASADITGDTPRIAVRNKDACAFGYRTSVFKELSGKEIILSATFVLSRATPLAVRQVVNEKIAWRTARQPLEYPNVGSIFKNVAWDLVPATLQARDDIKKHIKQDPFPVIPAAFLIDQAGLKGVSCGGAMISQKHPNFIVNACGAEANDVRGLVALIKAKVFNEFGIALHEEIEYI